MAATNIPSPVNSDNTGSVEIITGNTPQPLLHVNMTNVVKLSSTNYLMWSRQVLALFDGYELSQYLGDSFEPPSSTVLNAEGISVPNPLFTHWKRQDRLVYSALLGVISGNLQPMVSRAQTSADVWSILAETYAKPSRGHLKQIKHQLKSWTKGNKSIDEYLQGLTMRFDQLAILGKTIDQEDQVEYVLEGLPEEYKSLVDAIEGRDIPPMMTELHERLLNHEAKLLAATPLLLTPASANVAVNRHNNYNVKQNNNNNYKRPNHQWQQSQQQLRPQSQRPSKPYLGRCQICSVHGHSARRCPQLQQQNMTHGYGSVTSPYQSPTPWQPRANLALTGAYTPENWLLDSGATHHLTSDLHNLSLHQPYTGGDEVVVGNGSTLPITHTGSITLPSSKRSLLLNRVLCVPNIHRNLISVHRLCNTNRVSVEFFPTLFQVKDLTTGAPILQGRTKDELYEWPKFNVPITSFYAIPDTKTTFSQWHSRLGHPSFSILKSIVSSNSLPCFDSALKTFACNDCLLNKAHKLPFHESSISSSHPLDYIFTDVWQSPILSTDNYKYYLVLVDHFTCYTWLYPLKAKSQVKETFILFRALVENSLGFRIKHLYSDNGGEFLALKPFLSFNGISHLTSPPHTPEHNGVSERKHRHIVETGLSLLTHANIPLSYWPFAFSTAVFLINRMPTPVLSLQNPYQILFNKKPHYNKLRSFGCLCFPWLRPYSPNKLELRSLPCVFLGYSLTQSAYLCLEPKSGRIYTSRHVRFNETEYPFKKLSNLSSSVSQEHTPAAPSHIPLFLPVPLDSSPGVSEASSSVLSSSPLEQQTLPEHTDLPQPQLSTLEPEQHHSAPSSPHLSDNNNSGQSQSSQSGTGVSRNSSNNQPVSTNQTGSTSSQSSSPPPAAIRNHHSMQTRSKNAITKPNKKLSLVSVACPSAHREPNTWQQAMKDRQWRASMGSEFNSQIANHTWDLVPFKPHMNVVGCRWVHTLKYNADGTLKQHKS